MDQELSTQMLVRFHGKVLLAFGLWFVGCTFVGTSVALGAPVPQVDEMKIATRVAELQIQLQDSSLDNRQDAEDQLIAMGAIVLDYLEPTTNDTSTETVERIARIRKALETEIAQAFTQSKLVTIQGEYSVKDAVESLATQSGNKLVWLGGNEPVNSTPIDWNIEKLTFWQALDRLQDRGKISVNAYGGQQGELTLMEAASNSSPVGTDSRGVFQVKPIRISAVRSFENAGVSHSSLTLRVRWEPRLSPISISLPYKNIKVVYDDGQNYVPAAENNGATMAVQPEIPEIELAIPLKLPKQEANKIETITAQLKAVLPGRSEKFEFKRIGRLQPGYRLSKAGVSVSFEGIEKNGDLFGVTIKYEFDETGGALESHMSMVYENPLTLVDGKGNVLAPLATESGQSTSNSVSIVNYFADDPATMTLQCETPAMIVTTEMDIELKDIPLP